MRFISTLLTLAFAVLGVTSAAQSHEFPKAAKKISATLVQNYAECAAPDATTIGGGLPACLESEPVDTVCTFPGEGSGKVTLSISGTSVKVKSKLSGLAPTCDGQTLSVNLGVRVTTDDCTGGHCTVQDQVITAGTCTVADGKCSISAEVASGYPEGAGSAMQVVTCSVGRAGFDSFACGLLVP